MSHNNEKLRIRVKRVMVAIMSVLLMLTLVTTISFDVALYAVHATDEQPAAEAAAPAEGETAKPAEGEANKEAAKPAEGEANKEAAKPAEEAANKETVKPAEGAADNKTEAKAAEGAEGEAAAEPKTEGQQAIEEMLGEDLDEEDQGSSDPLDTGLRRKTEAPDLSSSSAVVMSGSTSEVVYEKHSERKMSPGSMTMLVTAMVVIDNMYNEDELKNTVDITKGMMKYGDTFKKGESVSVGDLLQAMLVGGSGQAAEALASYSASSRKIFIKEMNSKAMELGLMDTQFSNPRGAYSTKTYSTARDCAVIAQAAMRYQLVKDYFAQRSVTVKATSQSGEREVTLTNTNPLLTSKRQSELYNLCRGGILGEVGDPVDGCQYVGIAVVDDMELIVVLMDSKAKKVAYEAKSLLEYADTKVTRNVIVKAGKKVGRAKVRGGNITYVKAYTETKGFAYVPPEGSTDLVQTEVVMYDDLTAPLKEGSKVGEFRIYVADELKGTVDLVTKTDVRRGWWPSRYYISNFATVMIGLCLFAVLMLILRIIYVRKRREKMRAARRERRLREIAQQQLAIEEDRRRRNWTDRTGYGDQIAPRTGDLREEARRETMREELIAEAAKTGVSPKTIIRKKAKTEKKREAAKEKAKKKNTNVHN